MVPGCPITGMHVNVLPQQNHRQGQVDFLHLSAVCRDAVFPARMPRQAASRVK
jgi:hypothetical protein